MYNAFEQNEGLSTTSSNSEVPGSSNSSSTSRISSFNESIIFDKCPRCYVQYDFISMVNLVVLTNLTSIISRKKRFMDEQNAINSPLQAYFLWKLYSENHPSWCSYLPDMQKSGGCAQELSGQTCWAIYSSFCTDGLSHVHKEHLEWWRLLQTA